MGKYLQKEGMREKEKGGEGKEKVYGEIFHTLRNYNATKTLIVVTTLHYKSTVVNKKDCDHIGLNIVTS
jgi:hypothetical protein